MTAAHSPSPQQSAAEGSTLPPMRIGNWSAPVVPDILAEHLLELAFLAIQRRKLIFSVETTLRQVHAHQARMAAHWDGLVVGGRASALLALERFDEFDAWETAAAVRAWIELGTPTAAEIMARLDKVDDEKLPGWREGLKSVSPQRLLHLFPAAHPLEGQPSILSTLIYALGWHGILPSNAPQLAFSSHAIVRWSMARAVGWGGGAGSSPVAQPLLTGLLSDPETDVRRAALWSEALVNPASSLQRARSEIHAAKPDPFVIRLLGLLGSASDGDAIGRAGRNIDAGISEAAARALGDIGNPALVPLLIDMLDFPAADVATQSIRSILGKVPQLEPEKAAAPAEDDDDAPPPPPAAADVRAAWERDEPSYRGVDRLHRGNPVPWGQAPADEPMSMLWRGSLTAPRAELEWLRREVPDGFFTAVPDPIAVPGE